MNSPDKFKKPTIKDTSRAYVRLFGHFRTPQEWLEFLQFNRVEYMPFGMQREGDCAVRVIDLATNDLAVLGLEVPNVVKYHNNVPFGRSFWTEEFLSPTHRRHRVMEIGHEAQVLEDKVTHATVRSECLVG
jgi:hypothetical protein